MEDRKEEFIMVKVNAVGDNCPIPVIKTKKALAQLTQPDQVEVLVDNEIAVANVTKMAKSMGAEVSSKKTGEEEYTIYITVNEVTGREEGEEKSKKTTVVAIASDRMGSGNDELGKVLIKGFIYAVTQLEELPDTILFYNGGATLTVDSSDSLEDIRFLEENGVEVLTCGTCLNYYELTDHLAVGSVSNMYTIVEKLAGADKIIRP